MKNLCTLTDSSSYLNKGLALYDSLMAHSNVGEGFTLHYLCIDDQSYSKLVALNLPNLAPYQATAIPELSPTSKQYVHRENDIYTRWQHYCWSLSARFGIWLFQKQRLPSIMYIDSDIIMYHDIDLVYKDIGRAQLGLTPHLHNGKGDSVGAYNAGIVFFGAGASKVLGLWNECVCNYRGKYGKKYGTCGDQKYLELLEDECDSTHIIGSSVMQGAPWNFRLFDWSAFHMQDHVYVVYNDREFPLLWVHFSHFEPHYNINHYTSGEANYGNFLSVSTGVRDLYNDYLRLLRAAYERYGL